MPGKSVHQAKTHSSSEKRGKKAFSGASLIWHFASFRHIVAFGSKNYFLASSLSSQFTLGSVEFFVFTSKEQP